MTTTPDLTNGKSIAELDQLINQAMAAKQALADAKIEDLLGRLEKDCAEIDITPKQLLALYTKRKRKARTHKDDGSDE